MNLAGLTFEERRELLMFLEEQERRRAGARAKADAIEDTMQPLEEFLKEFRHDDASRTDDPEAYLRAYDAHRACVDRHMQALWVPPTRDVPIDQCIGAYLAVFHKAEELVETEHPSPGWQDFKNEEAAATDAAPLSEPEAPRRHQPVKPAPPPAQPKALPLGPTPATDVPPTRVRQQEERADRDCWRGRSSQFNANLEPRCWEDGV
jgi:hypothetical protein